MRDLLAKLHTTLGQVPRAGVQALLPAARPSTHRIEASTGGPATVWIFDAIGEGGVSARELVPAIAALDVKQIDVRVNSPGGDYFDGVAIANALAEHPARVEVHVDGLAASAASVIAMGGDRVVMHPGAQMMIHDALTLTIGNAEQHDKTSALLDSASADIAALYAARAGNLPAEGFRALMRAETWYTGEQAVAAGLAHEHVTPAPAESTLTTAWAERLAAFHAAKTTEASSPAPAASPVEASAPPVLPIAARLCSAFSERKTP